MHLLTPIVGKQLRSRGETRKGELVFFIFLFFFLYHNLYGFLTVLSSFSYVSREIGVNFLKSRESGDRYSSYFAFSSLERKEIGRVDVISNGLACSRCGWLDLCCRKFIGSISVIFKVAMGRWDRVEGNGGQESEHACLRKNYTFFLQG